MDSCLSQEHKFEVKRKQPRPRFEPGFLILLLKSMKIRLFFFYLIVWGSYFCQGNESENKHNGVIRVRTRLLQYQRPTR